MALPGISSSQPLTVLPAAAPRYSDTTVRRVAYAILTVGIITLGAIGYGLFSLYRRVTRSSKDLLSQGDALYHKGFFEKAILKYTAALAYNPADKELRAQIYYMRGFQYSLLKQNYQAYKDYSVAFDENPSEKLKATILNAKGDVHFRIHQYDEAITAYTTALTHINALNSDHKTLQVQIFKNRGNAYYKIKGGVEKAIADYTKALEFIDSTETRAQFLLKIAKFNLKIGEYEKTEENCKDAEKCNPTNQSLVAGIMFLQGKLLIAQGKQDDGIKIYKEVLGRFIPDNRLRARILCRLGKEHVNKIGTDLALEALNYFKSALEFIQESGSEKILFKKARLCQILGKIEEGKQDLQFALVACNPYDLERLNRINDKLKEMRKSS